MKLQKKKSAYQTCFKICTKNYLWKEILWKDLSFFKGVSLTEVSRQFMQEKTMFISSVCLLLQFTLINGQLNAFVSSICIMFTQVLFALKDILLNIYVISRAYFRTKGMGTIE